MQRHLHDLQGVESIFDITDSQLDFGLGNFTGCLHTQARSQVALLIGACVWGQV